MQPMAVISLCALLCLAAAFLLVVPPVSVPALDCTTTARVCAVKMRENHTWDVHSEDRPS